LQAPKWLHTIADVDSAPSISQLVALVDHPSHYDYTYLAAALNRLAVLAEQQQKQQQQQQHVGDLEQASNSQRQEQIRLTRAITVRLKQLQADATAAELSVVLTAATKLGVRDAKFYSGATAAAVSAERLAAASGGYLADIMYAVAEYGSRSSGNGGGGGGSSRNHALGPDAFGKKQQQAVLRTCLTKMVQLIQHQQQPGGAGFAAAAAAAAIAGTDGPSALEPSNVIMALWAASSAGIQALQQRHLLTIFKYLNQPEVLRQLTANTTTTSSSKEGPLTEGVVLTCGTVIWAAAQLGFTGDLSLLKPYASALLQAAESTPLACTSTLTVVLSLASLMQQQQQGPDAAADDVQYWQGCFLQCSQAVVASMQQQQQQQGQQYAAAVASQLLWGYDVAGLDPPQEQLHALMALTGDEVSHVMAGPWH
jgi:hypothetical protein